MTVSDHIQFLVTARHVGRAVHSGASPTNVEKLKHLINMTASCSAAQVEHLFYIRMELRVSMRVSGIQHTIGRRGGGGLVF